MSQKSERRNWKIRVMDILDSITRIQSYTIGMNEEQFRTDQKTIDAVIRNLEIIGEAAGYIPLEIQEKYPQIAWLEMRGMRNLMIHEYFVISLPIIWQTVQNDLTPLAAGLQKLLSDQENS